MTIPTFVINLDRRPERWAAISANLDGLGIAYERVSAVDGALLDDRDRWPKVTAAEQGCTLSHLEAIRRFSETSAPSALILEDDVEVASDLPRLLDSFDWWPGGARVVKIDTSGLREFVGPRFGKMDNGRSLHRVVYTHIGCGGYFIGPEAAKIMLAAPYETSIMPIDNAMFDMRISGTAKRLRSVRVIPAMVRHRREQFGSDIELSRNARRFRPYSRGRLFLKKFPSKIVGLYMRQTGQLRRSVVPYCDTLDR